MSQLTSLAHRPLDAPAPTPAHALSRRAKAAIVVQFILQEGADVPLSALPEDLQMHLTHLLGNMRYVDRNTMHAVISEFAEELDAVGLSFPGDIAGALSALDGKISDRTAARLRKEAGVRQIGDPWKRIAALPQTRLKDLILSESVQIGAVVLAKLDVGKAAELLGTLPGDQARRLTYAMSMTDTITPDAVDRIGLSLAGQIDAEPPKAFRVQSSERVGAILNFSRAAKRDELLGALDEDDQTFADAVRKSIFTFAHLPKTMTAIDVPKITRDVDQDTLARIIAGASSEEDKAAVDFVLSNISKRMAEALREVANDLGTPNAKDVESAMNAVVRVVRDLADSGEITLRKPDEEADA